MAKKRISYKRKKRNRKSDNIEGIPTTHVPLCAMGEVSNFQKIMGMVQKLTRQCRFSCNLRGLVTKGGNRDGI